MMPLILVLPMIVSFLISLFFIPHWIRRAHESGLVGKDMNKFDKPTVAEGGGISVVAGFLIGVLIYIAIKTFYFQNPAQITNIFALLTSVLMISIIGLVDTILGWKKGLGRRLRLVLVLFAAIPLMVINAGTSTVSLPFIGLVPLGIFYALIIVPLGILGASTTFNFLAGYNGLEARQGILLLGALAIATYFTGNSWLSLILLCMIASLLAFLLFNKFPAKVFPGDVLTYSVGALIAVVAILGNLERFALFIFIPNIIEILLKARGKLKAESFAEPMKDGSLNLKYDKIYGLEHFAIKVIKKIKDKVYEQDVVLFINIIQLCFIILGFIIYRSGIFFNV